ncbi:MULTISPECIES: NAD(P)-dependent oxidoreductase [Aminobacterium]|uniref:NAD(P)-dependent oxidoreductase n=1 Tax=Aminobacterium TaxID=81466 RepID=UPI00257BC755|nr:NAD(P)-dependent oxidoreductase [Aminobacterium sp. UBA4987]
MAELSLGFVGFGEVSFCISSGLRDEGLSGICAYDVVLGSGTPYEENLRKRANEANVILCDTPEELFRSCNVIVSAVQAPYAGHAAKSALSHMSAGSLYVDVTTAAPAEKEHWEKEFQARSIYFADSAMMGPLTINRHKVPMIASGCGASLWQEKMVPLGMKIDVVKGPAGDGTRIKLVRSVFMKGLGALLVETFLLAHRSDLEDVVLKSISATVDQLPFEKTISRMLGADMIHAERRVHEVAESIALMETVGLKPVMAAATKERLELSAAMGLKDELAGVAPKTIEEACSVWDRKNYR